MPDVANDCNETRGDNNILGLMRQLEVSMNSRLEPMSFRLLMSLPDAYSTFRIVNSEVGFKVSQIVNDKRLHAELESAMAALEDAHRQLPVISLTERMTLNIRQMAWVLMDSTAPLALLRPGLTVLSAIQSILCLHVPAAREFHQIKSGALSDILQEPLHKTAKLIRQHQFYLYWNYARRLQHLGQTNSVNPLVPDFNWAERADYSAMTDACKDSRVLVTIHMGDFFGAFRCIADELQESRPVISLRREGETNGIKNLNQRLAANHQVFMHGKDNPVRVVKALRAGGQTLSVLFDLGADFGETTDVMFFGHRARFVRGPAEMAILGRARIYPFVCFEDGGRACINMEPSFLPEIRADESLQDAVTRVTQMLVTLAERWIRQNPAQWKYLDRLPHYLILDELAPDADIGTRERQGAGFDA